MKNVGWAALIGAGVALVAFLIDWLADKLDTPEEAEPLWPASKPYSRTTVHYPKGDLLIIDDPVPSKWPPSDEQKARVKAWVDSEMDRRMAHVDRNFLNPTPETWKMP